MRKIQWHSYKQYVKFGLLYGVFAFIVTTLFQAESLISILIGGILIFMLGKFFYDLLKLEYPDKKRMIVVAILGFLPYLIIMEAWGILRMISIGTEGIIRRVIFTSGLSTGITVLLTLWVYRIYKRLGLEIPD